MPHSFTIPSHQYRIFKGVFMPKSKNGLYNFNPNLNYLPDYEGVLQNEST